MPRGFGSSSHLTIGQLVKGCFAPLIYGPIQRTAGRSAVVIRDKSAAHSRDQQEESGHYQKNKRNLHGEFGNDLDRQRLLHRRPLTYGERERQQGQHCRDSGHRYRPQAIAPCFNQSDWNN